MNNEVDYEEEYAESSDEFKKNGFVFPDSFDVDETNKKIGTTLKRLSYVFVNVLFHIQMLSKK